MTTMLDRLEKAYLDKGIILINSPARLYHKIDLQRFPVTNSNSDRTLTKFILNNHDELSESLSELEKIISSQLELAEPSLSPMQWAYAVQNHFFDATPLNDYAVQNDVLSADKVEFGFLDQTDFEKFTHHLTEMEKLVGTKKCSQYLCYLESRANP